MTARLISGGRLLASNGAEKSAAAMAGIKGFRIREKSTDASRGSSLGRMSTAITTTPGPSWPSTTLPVSGS